MTATGGRVAYGGRIFNLSGLLSAEQVLSLADVEIARLEPDDLVMVVVSVES